MGNWGPFDGPGWKNRVRAAECAVRTQALHLVIASSWLCDLGWVTSQIPHLCTSHPDRSHPMGLAFACSASVLRLRRATSFYFQRASTSGFCLPLMSSSPSRRCWRTLTCLFFFPVVIGVCCGTRASLVVARGLRCPEACGISVPSASESVSCSAVSDSL